MRMINLQKYQKKELSTKTKLKINAILMIGGNMISKKIKELRLKKKITQQELADAIYVSREAVSKWEQNRGVPSKDNLELLANYFEISIDELVNEDYIQEVIDNKNKNIKILSIIIGALAILATLLSVILFNEKSTSSPIEKPSFSSAVDAGPYYKYGVVEEIQYVGNVSIHNIGVYLPRAGTFIIPDCNSIIYENENGVINNYNLQIGDLISLEYNSLDYFYYTYPGQIGGSFTEIKCFAKGLKLKYDSTKYRNFESLTIPLEKLDFIPQNGDFINISYTLESYEIEVQEVINGQITLLIPLMKTEDVLKNYLNLKFLKKDNMK